MDSSIGWWLKKNSFIPLIFLLYRLSWKKFWKCPQLSEINGKPLIKLVSKWKGASRKGHTSFFVFHFWDFKLVPIHSELNSTSGSIDQFLSQMWTWSPEEQPNLQKLGSNFSKMSFGTYSRKTGKCWNQNFGGFSRSTTIWVKYAALNFDSDDLTCGAHLFLPQKCKKWPNFPR